MSEETLLPLVPPKPLTSDQHLLVTSALGMVDRALATVRRRFRKGLPDQELVAIGHQTLCEAAQTFDPTRGVPFEGYAWRFVHGALWDALECETRFQRAVRLGAYKAAEVQQEESGRAMEVAAPGAPEVQDFSDAVVAGMMAEVVAQARRQRVLDDPEEPVAYAQAIKALQTALSELSKEDRALVELHYYQDVPIYLAGAPLNMGRTVVKARHRGVLKRLSARLRSLGIAEAPAPRGVELELELELEGA